METFKDEVEKGTGGVEKNIQNLQRKVDKSQKMSLKSIIRSWRLKLK